jgi:hypothetical protein
MPRHTSVYLGAGRALCRYKNCVTVGRWILREVNLAGKLGRIVPTAGDSRLSAEAAHRIARADGHSRPPVKFGRCRMPTWCQDKRASHGACPVDPHSRPGL